MEFFGWLAQGGFEKRGYVVPEQDNANLAATLRWKSPTNADMDRVSGEARNRGITVSFKATPYTVDELTAMAGRLFADADLATTVKVNRVIGAPGDSVTPRVVVSSAGSSRMSAEARSKRDALLVSVAGGTVEIQEEATSPEPLALRASDTQPFNAGGMIKYNTSVPCSTGFALYYRGAPFTTTAAHCVGSNYRTWNGGLSYGYSYGTSSDGGAMVLTGSGWRRMFTGGPNGSGYRDVWGYADIGLGGMVCTSGAMTGEHCNLWVNNMYVIFQGFSTISAVNLSGTVAAGNGDSGGPVYVNLDGTGTGRLGAQGMIQNGVDPVPCGPVQAPTTCYQTVWFSSTRTIAQSLGASLVTSRGNISPW